MKKLSFLPFVFLTLFGFAQKQFVVEGSITQSFETLTEAIEAAAAGDTLYIPGGGFTTPATIDKQLHWRGVGHYPDSTVATGASRITSYITFTGNCDGSTFEGIYFAGDLRFGNVANQEVTDIKIRRCRVDGTIYLRYNNNTDSGQPLLNFQLAQSVVLHIDANNGKGCLVENNLIFGEIREFHNSIFRHNSVNSNVGSARLIQYSTNCQFLNNVFAYEYNLYNSQNCNFQNNIFQGGLPFNPVTETHTGSANLTGTGITNLYTGITGNIYTFSYDNDYHLGSATGTDENGNTGVAITGTATDGTNAGIYGGPAIKQYKEGAVPYLPHVRDLNIANEAVDGNLDVKITVAAQEK